MNGGISGLSGAFLGVNYQTKQLLGLGETLSLQGNLGNVSRQFCSVLRKPYIRNRPPTSDSSSSHQAGLQTPPRTTRLPAGNRQSDRGAAVAHARITIRPSTG